MHGNNGENLGVNPIVLRQRPLPLEALPPVHRLDGGAGDNRNTHQRAQIDAATDLEAIHCWLAEFADSPQTYRAYRKEAERLLLWAWKMRGKPLSSLVREDFTVYQDFLNDPQPAAYWCGPRADRDAEQWRPFQGPLKASSQRQALIVINALFSYLVEAGYLVGNPLSLIRRRTRRLLSQADHHVAIERFLDRTTWEYLKQFIAEMPRDTERQGHRYERTRFLFHFLYLLAPRVSEAAGHTMNSFREYRGKWWWFVLGKGNKRAKVPVTDEMLDALMRYRRFLGLPDLPPEDDDSPLLRSIGGTRAVTSSTVYRMVKTVVTEAADSIQDVEPAKAAKLRKASTHWFRHTAVTHQDDAGLSLKYINKNARHQKLETTAIYQHAEEDLWHEETQRHRY